MSGKPYLIGIAGPSGSGKTYLAEHLVRELKHATILPIDAYYPDLGHLPFEERHKLNFDDPNVLDTALLFVQVNALADGETIQQPVYDFARHTRTKQTRTVHPVEFVIVEGLFTLHWPELRARMQTAVFVEMQDADCLERRLVRDVQERGRTPESVEEQFRISVVPMAEKYVRPTARFADVMVHGGTNVADEVAAVLAHIRRGRGK